MPQLNDKGTYIGVLTGCGVSTTEKKATPFFYLTFNVVQKVESNKQRVNIEPFSRDVILYLSDDAYPYASENLQSIGFNGNFSNPEFSEEKLTSGITLLCNHEPGIDDSSKLYERWTLARWVKSGLKKDPAPQTVIDSLQARWGTTSVQSQQATGTDDDLPFV